MRKFALLSLCVLTLAAISPHARAEQSRWTDRYPEIVEDVRSGQPLTLLVMVALCDSALIACGGQGAGDPASLDENLYWGRAFGARRYFDETGKRHGWQRVAGKAAAGRVLEELVYRRWVVASPWFPEGRGSTGLRLRLPLGPLFLEHARSAGFAAAGHDARSDGARRLHHRGAGARPRRSRQHERAL